jgi:outer membrane lipoprotein-sorting protein
MIGLGENGRVRRLAAVLWVGALLAGCAGRPGLVLTADDRATVASVQAYLDGLREFHANFTATGTEGSADGVLWVDRPGRLRVQYVHPPKLLLANHGRLLLADQSTGATSNMPVSNTPLDILLADRIELSGAVTVVSLQHQPGQFQIGLEKSAAPGQGRLTLQFGAAPLTLRGVVVQDSAGHTNTLSLGPIFRDSTTDPRLFHYQPPAAAE